MEAAVVMPFFFMIAIGIVECGYAMMANQAIVNSAREGARTAVFDGKNNETVRAAVQNTIQGCLGADVTTSTVSITVIHADGSKSNVVGSAARGDTIIVDVSIPYADVSFLPKRWTQDATLRGRQAMRKI